MRTKLTYSNKVDWTTIFLGFVFFLYTNPFYTWQLSIVVIPIEALAFLLMLKNTNIPRGQNILSLILFSFILVYLSIVGGNNVIGVISLVSTKIF